MNERILAFCDSPTLTSGFARVAQNVFRRWQAAGAAIDIWGIGFTGWGYKRVPYVDTIFPAGGGGEWATPQRLELFLAQLATGGYTHLWMMQDTFMLSVGDFPAKLRQVCTEKKIRSMLYFPVDAPLDPAWTDIIAAVDVPVAYTLYGKVEAEAKGRLRGHNFTCEIAPHGVDTGIYHPLAERAKLRETLWQQPWVGPNDFLMLNVNANQRRKDVARSLEIVAGLRAMGIPAKLLMHMAESSYEGLSLKAVADQLGLVELRDWAHHGFYFRNGHSSLGENELPKYYNVADLYLTTTLGEGWGLGITEALACGCPVALPMHTACLEIAEQAGEGGLCRRLVPLETERDYVALDRDNSRLRRRVAVRSACEAIAAYHHSGRWRHRQTLAPGLAARWSWDDIAARMLRGLRESR